MISFMIFFACVLASIGSCCHQEAPYSEDELQEKFDVLIKRHQSRKEVPSFIRDFDPAQGRADCEEQALILIDFLRKGKLFSKLSLSEQHYFKLRNLFKKIEKTDAFGMVIARKDNHILEKMSPEKGLRLRHEISTFVDQKMKQYTQELLPQYVNDPAFDLLPIGKYAIPRISTTGGIAILFAYAKKYKVPVMLHVKRMQTIGNGLKGQGEAFLPYVYNEKTQKFEYKDDIPPHAPIVCIRAFSITKGKESSKTIPHFLSKRFKDMALLFNRLRQIDNFEDYQHVLKTINLENLMMVLAAREDFANKRPMSQSVLLKSYPQALSFFYDDEEYVVKKNGKEFYTQKPKVIAIRHVYVSTLAEQKQSTQKRLEKMGKKDFSEIMLKSLASSS